LIARKQKPNNKRSKDTMHSDLCGNTRRTQDQRQDKAYSRRAQQGREEGDEIERGRSRDEKKEEEREGRKN
jgi:hypothetical protein